MKVLVKRRNAFFLLKFGNIYCLKLFMGSEIDIIYILRQPWSEIIGTTTKNGNVPVFHKQSKTLFRDHMVKMKIMSLHI